MTVSAVVLALLLSGADDLAPLSVNGLKLRVPSAWKHAVEDGSHKYDAPSEDASFEISVFPVDPRRDGKICVDQLVKALGDNGWERISVGAAPAAKRVITEAAATAPREGEEGKKPPPPVEVQTNSYVGCNGATKWVLTLTMSAKKKERFDALAKKMVASISYGK